MDEARDARIALEQALTALVKDFEAQTGCCVRLIRPNHFTDVERYGATANKLRRRTLSVETDIDL